VDSLQESFSFGYTFSPASGKEHVMPRTRSHRIVALMIVAVVGLSLFAAWRSAATQTASAQGVPRLHAFKHVSFNGDYLDIAGDTPTLPKTEEGVVIDEENACRDWNDQITSIIVVQGTWRLYQHANFNKDEDGNAVDGWSCLVSGSDAAPDGVRYPRPASLGFGNDDISSIELVSEQNLPDWVRRAPQRVAPEKLIHDPDAAKAVSE
jgi:hypothetical protein